MTHKHSWEELPQWGYVCSDCDFRPANDTELFREAERDCFDRNLLASQMSHGRTSGHDQR